MRVKRGVVGPRRPGATSLSSHAGTEDVVGARPRKPTQFDDQRPGWDFTSGDVGKFKLTEEQVKVRRARIYRSRAAPRWPSPDVPGSRTPRLARVRFLNFSCLMTHHPRQKTLLCLFPPSPRLTAARLPTVTPSPGATRPVHVQAPRGREGCARGPQRGENIGAAGKERNAPRRGQDGL